MTRVDQVPPPDVPDGESAKWGSSDEIEIRFDPNIGANGAYVIRDAVNNQDRFELRVGDVLRLLAQNLDVNGVDIEDAGTTIYDAATGSLNVVDDTPVNFGAGPDVSERYSTGDDDLRWQDEQNDQDRMALDRSTGDVSIEGTISESASLSP